MQPVAGFLLLGLLLQGSFRPGFYMRRGPHDLLLVLPRPRRGGRACSLLLVGVSQGSFRPGFYMRCAICCWFGQDEESVDIFSGVLVIVSQILVVIMFISTAKYLALRHVICFPS